MHKAHARKLIPAGRKHNPSLGCVKTDASVKIGATVCARAWLPGSWPCFTIWCHVWVTF